MTFRFRASHASAACQGAVNAPHSRRALVAGGSAHIRAQRCTWRSIAACLTIAALVIACCFWKFRASELTPDAIWERAQANFRAGRYDEVALDLGRLERMRKPTTLDWFLRGQLAAIREQLDEANADLAKVPDDHQVAAHARLISGQIERRRDRARLAEAAFLAALRLDPSLVQARRELISIYGIQFRRAEFKAEFVALQKLTALELRRRLSLDVAAQ